jgi:tetratricopeptide (TPR) repeat protein
VATVLEGSIQKAGNRLRITGQLINVSDGYHLWSEKYDRDMDDIFAIQDEISEAIVSKLKPTLLRSEKAKLGARQTVAIETYDLYLKGRYFQYKATGESLKKAIDYFEQALAIDPHYAQAYAGLADAHLVLPIYSSSRPQETYQKGRRAAIRALEIDNTLAEAHTSMGFVKYAYDWDWRGGEEELKQAIELNPGYAMAHYHYAHYLLRVNRFDEAIAEMEKAQKLDPLSLEINRELGTILIWAGQFDRAIEVLRKTVEMDPNHPYTHLLLGLAYSAKSMNEEALREFEREREVLGVWNAAAECSIANWHALVGKRDKALDILNTFLMRSKTEYVPPTFIGLLYLTLGDIDRGFEWLDKACDGGDVWLLYIQGIPDTAPLLSDPRFSAILRKMGLES